MGKCRIEGKANAPDSIVIDEAFRRRFSEYCLIDDYYMSVFFRDDAAERPVRAEK